MEPILTAGIIAGAASLAGSGANAYAQGKMNKRALNYNREAYAKQRADALTDYATQNEYNSPRAQMQRLKEAGLNPNLIYGKGSEAAPVRSTEMQQFNGRPAQWDIGGAVQQGLSAYLSTQMQKEQIDQLRSNITAQQQDMLLKAAQTTNTLAQTESTKFDIAQKTRLADTSAQVMEATLKNIQQQTGSSQTSQQIALNEDQRRAALTSQSLKEGATRILQIQAQTSKIPAEKRQIEAAIKEIQSSAALKQKELELRNKNINPNDPMWQRELMDLIKPILDNLKQPSKGKPLGIGMDIIKGTLFPHK